jgi:hypothetical protein
MSGEQALVLLLLAAAFAAGWFARGGAPRGDQAPLEAGSGPGGDPLLDEADAALDRALMAVKASRAMAGATGAAAGAARQAALGVLDRRLDELEELADRLEARLGGESEAFGAFDQAVSDVLRARREVAGDAALSAAEGARNEWRRVAAVPTA